MCSAIRESKCGVPQRSVLDPVFFNMKLYVDDTDKKCQDYVYVK